MPEYVWKNANWANKREFHHREALNTVVIVHSENQATHWSLTPRIFLWHLEQSGAKNFS